MQPTIGCMGEEKGFVPDTISGGGGIFCNSRRCVRESSGRNDIREKVSGTTRRSAPGAHPINTAIPVDLSLESASRAALSQLSIKRTSKPASSNFHVSPLESARVINLLSRVGCEAQMDALTVPGTTSRTRYNNELSESEESTATTVQRDRPGLEEGRLTETVSLKYPALTLRLARVTLPPESMAAILREVAVFLNPC